MEVDVPSDKDAEHHADFQATATHPWRTTDGHWVPTAQLHGGMTLVRADGAPARVEWVRDTNRKAPTYNLTVEGYHTYFVGKDHIWVHNACNIGPKIARQAPGRGWSASDIEQAVGGQRIGSAINRATGNAASVYGSGPSSYVVVDDVTGDVVQVSNLNDPNWVPDPSIIFF